ncbi:transmembrane protein 107 isoform X2 [Sarcophilus harrisii]|uniref:transmembrane protein 107 isoform X2 n=1 Tax=Sarcophilus harrisii TaxID=9305 RepID=UPI00062B4BD1|nr:transmembrane protein 107 isoform X2 [Sarcophilus harrisii]
MGLLILRRFSIHNFSAFCWGISEWSFWDDNIRASLPPSFTSDQYKKEDSELVTALSITLGLFLIELAGFFSGVSMFNNTQSLFSIALHCCAAVSLAFFVFESWECSTYWYIFTFCSVLPAFTEVIMFITVFVLKKKSF